MTNSTKSRLTTDQPLVAIGLFSLAMMIFSATDGAAKYLSADIAPQQIIFLRYVVVSVLILLFCSYRGQRNLLKTAQPKLQILRGLLLAVICLRSETSSSGAVCCYWFCFTAFCHGVVYPIFGRKGRLETVDSGSDWLAQCTDDPTSRGCHLSVGHAAATWFITVLGDGTHFDAPHARQ